MNNYPEVRKLNPSLYETIDFFEMDYAEGSFSYNNLQSLSGITASYAPKALKKEDTAESMKLEFGEMPGSKQVLITRALAETLKNKLRIEELENDRSLSLILFEKDYAVSGIAEGENPYVYFNRADYVNFLSVYQEIRFTDNTNLFFKSDFIDSETYKTINSYSAEICVYTGETLDLNDNQCVVEINRKHYHECKNCDAKKDVEAHVFGEWKKEVAPTVEDYGVMAHKDCTVCARHFDNDGNEITDLRIAKIGTHKVIVNGESKFYAHGESATVTAEDKEGKAFKGWKDESGNIVSTKKEYTFNVEGEKTLTAVYEDKPSGGGEITPPAKKDGLSGGQIAGIVIGSVAVAGIGGFAFVWFAIKKKTFADLITAIKTLFAKKK